MLAELGEDARLLAGGQSLIPLMKLRLASPAHLVDLNFVPDLSYNKQENGTVRFGALTRHAEVAESKAAAAIPILHDCAAGIADVQVRNRGTIGGSLAEADPSGDWAPVLYTLGGEVIAVGPQGERTIPILELITDAYTTILRPEEVLREVVVKAPPKNSGGACLAFKRSAPVYATASAAVQVTLAEKDTCQEIGIGLGAVGLTPIKAVEAEAVLRGRRLTDKRIEATAKAAEAACDPQPDMRGTAEFKRNLVQALVKRALQIAVRRARGETVQGSHVYA